MQPGLPPAGDVAAAPDWSDTPAWGASHPAGAEPPPARTPPNLLATDPRAAEPAWMSLAGPGDPQVQEQILAELRESTRPILDLKALLEQEAARQAEPVPAPAAPRSPAMPPAAFDLSAIGVELDLPDAEVVPWDRRPLMVVLAAAAALVLLGVGSGVASASLFGRGPAPVGWLPTGADSGPSVTAPAAPPPSTDTITFSGVGDVIMGTQPGDIPPRNGAGFFDPVKDALAADLVMGNLETPLTPDTGRVKCRLVTPSPRPGDPSPKPTTEAGCHQFYLPPSYAEHLRDGGFQLMNLANNHTHDMGIEGLRNTREALDSAGIRHTGAPNQITYVEVKGAKVAVIGFAIYSWSQNLNNIPAAKALVEKAAAAADIVVIQMQGGAEGSDKAHVRPGTEEFFGENRGDLMKFTRAVIDSGADVVFGHGPHIMRGMEFYKGRLIAYSLGNFCGFGVLSSSGYLGVGGVLKVTLRKDGTWVGGQLIATEMVRGGMVAVDAQKRALSFVNALSRDDFGASAAKISTRDGKITRPESD
jgi:hypothetical protein